jgi:hypothetical protein
MDGRTVRHSAWLAAVYALLALVLLAGGTYAWFSFRPDANVTPLSGTISDGEGDLLISNQSGGPFDTSCELLLNDPETELLPVTTADLEHFYAVSAQDAAGVATAYRAADERAAAHTLNGTLYLRAEGSGFQVYLWQPSMDCGQDTQALAALRLGLRIQTAAGVQTHIFLLDELGDTAGAESQQTIPRAGEVVASAGEDGSAGYTADPARALSDSTARGTEEAVLAGTTALCSLADGETAEVKFWLYLEGCDDNCINSAQGRDIALQLGFAGVQSD